MSNPWFRLYAEFATDPKVQMMSEALQRRFVMLLCIRCGNGDVTLHDNEIAFQLRVTEAEWSETKATFIAKGFIDQDNNILHWEKRQYVSDSSAERVRKHREKKRNEAKRARNVTVTPPDTDTDTETTTSLRSAVERDARKPDPRDGSPVPDDFTPNRAGELKAGELGLDLQTETDRFIAHYQAKGETRSDWQAQFRKWLLDAAQYDADRRKVTDSKLQAVRSTQSSRSGDLAAIGVGSQYRTEVPYLEAANAIRR